MSGEKSKQSEGEAAPAGEAVTSDKAVDGKAKKKRINLAALGRQVRAARPRGPSLGIRLRAACSYTPTPSASQSVSYNIVKWSGANLGTQWCSEWTIAG